MARLPWIAVLALVACGGSDAAKSIPPRNAPAAPPSAAEGTASTPTRAAPAPSAPLTLALRAQVSTDGVGLRVINTGNELVSLAPDVALELAQGERYVSLDPKALTLRLDCASQGCVKLAPGAELVAPSWLDRIGGERCDTLAKRPAPGEYRLVVKRCGGADGTAASFVIPNQP